MLCRGDLGEDIVQHWDDSWHGIKETIVDPELCPLQSQTVANIMNRNF